MSGVYETLRTYSGVFVFLSDHQKRLESSCAAIGVETPNLESLVAPYLGKEVRLVVTVDKEGEVDVKSEDLQEWDGSFLYPEAWKVKPVEGERKHPELKSMDTSMQKEARAAAQREGFDEILLVNREGNITEGGITNVFFVEGDHLVTPGSGILKGIARTLVFEAAQTLGITVEERDVALSELDKFEVVFLTNSIRGMVATGPVHPLMKRIADWCSLFLQQRINAEKGHPNHGNT